MKKIIYSTKEFRPDFIEKIKKIAPNYHFETSYAAIQPEDIEVMIGWDKVHGSTIIKNGTLKWIQTISAGVDYLPLKNLQKQSILLSNGSGIHRSSISEHVLGVILGYSRGLFAAKNYQQQKKWAQSLIHYQEIREKKLLIVGTGKIGSELAKQASTLGLHCEGINTSGHPVTYFDKTYPLAQLNTAVANADFVVNILPLTDETKFLFELDIFKQFKSSAVFINVGRGPSVRTNDLIDALQNNYLAFAALDVFEEEPLDTQSPLWTMDNVFVTPHISGLTNHFEKRFMDIFLPNLESFIKEQTLINNEVNLDSGY